MRSLLYSSLINNFYKSYQPTTKHFLNLYEKQARQITDSTLKKEALASLSKKAFHCYGASFYAVLAKDSLRQDYLKFMTAYQTMCDYLDNLVDQTKVINETNFRRLHQSLLDVFKLTPPTQNYYQYQIQQHDSGYLNMLVRLCQESLKKIPHYALYASWLERLAGLYVELQVYKHLELSKREERLIQLRNEHQRLAKNLSWFEFSAACGSTLGIFTLVAYAMNQERYNVSPEEIFYATFPAVQELHIMLDYLIDLEEDKEDGELNFFSYYNNLEVGVNELLKIYHEAQQGVLVLPEKSFHQTINDGLFALYLAEGVKKNPDLSAIQTQIKKKLGFRARFLFYHTKKFVK